MIAGREGIRGYSPDLDLDNVISHVLLGEPTGGLGESGREHEVGMISVIVDI